MGTRGENEVGIVNSLSIVDHLDLIYVTLGYANVFCDLTKANEVHVNFPWDAGPQHKKKLAKQIFTLLQNFKKEQPSSITKLYTFFVLPSALYFWFNNLWMMPNFSLISRSAWILICWEINDTNEKYIFHNVIAIPSGTLKKNSYLGQNVVNLSIWWENAAIKHLTMASKNITVNDVYRTRAVLSLVSQFYEFRKQIVVLMHIL